MKRLRPCHLRGNGVAHRENTRDAEPFPLHGAARCRAVSRLLAAGVTVGGFLRLGLPCGADKDDAFFKPVVIRSRAVMDGLVSQADCEAISIVCLRLFRHGFNEYGGISLCRHG